MAETVLITGANSGIGEACAYLFGRAGYRLILTARSAEKIKPVIDSLSSEGIEAISLIFDITDRDAVIKAFSSLPEEWKRVDILINNAGGALGLEPLQEGKFEDWDGMIDANIKGLLTMTRIVVPGMIERNHGQVINIGSVAGDAAYASGNVYCATKAAVKAITDGLRIDTVSTNIRVCNIKPGLVETNFSRARFHGDEERAEKVYQGIEPLKAEDIASVALYAAKAPAHVQIAEVLVLATHQASGSVVYRES